MADTFFDTLRPASFRGISFEVENHSESGGRRLVRHEYPLRDMPYTEDLGKKAGSWQVEAFLVRSKSVDYAAARDKLREALSAEGPGTLVHPYLGEMTVSVESYTMKETTREGGYCTFSVVFVESGSLDKPDAKTDTAAATLSAAATATEAAKAVFLSEYAPLLEDLEALADTLPDLLSKGGDYLGASLAVMSKARSVAAKYLNLPEELAGQIIGYLGDLTDLMNLDFNGLRLDSLSTLLGRRGSSSGASSGTSGTASWADATPSTITTRAVAPIVDLITAEAVIEVAAATAETEFVAADDALAARDRIVEAVDVIQEKGCSDTVFAALSDLRAAVHEDMTTRGAELPSLVAVCLTSTMPALLASYRLYGDTGRADEIVTRNRVRHPGRVPGGVRLEVLRD